MLSLDAPLDIDPTLTIGESLPDEQNLPPDMIMEQTEMMELVRTWIGELSTKQRGVIERRYGLNDAETMTLDQIAQNMGVTRERIRQIQNEALGQLRNRLAEQGIVKEMMV